MKLSFEQREAGDVTVLELTGRIIMGGECSKLRGQLQHLQHAGRGKILLDLAGVTFIDSSGVGTLVVQTGTIEKHGGQLKMINASKHFLETLAVARLRDVLDIYATEEEALASFP